jgi:hypothetical protein
MAPAVEVRVRADRLRLFVAGLFEDTGCSQPHAADIADCLVQSNCGVSTRTASSVCPSTSRASVMER